MDPQPKIRPFESSLFELKNYVDIQLDSLRGRLAEYERVEFDRHVRDLQGTINMSIKTANEQFQRGMEKSRSIQNAFLREQNEKSLRENLASQIDALNKILENFVSRYSR